jgi:AbrB family looped-hinge helix DNA binding protein
MPWFCRGIPLPDSLSVLHLFQNGWRDSLARDFYIQSLDFPLKILIITSKLRYYIYLLKKSGRKDLPTRMADKPNALTGKALLQKVKEVSHLSKRETAKACGYYSLSKDDQVRVNLADFYDALLEAKGIQLEPDKAKKDGRGREASYRVNVHKNGQIVIGAAYTKEMNLKPGDEFQIKLGYKHIHLIQIGEDDEED